MRWKLEILPIFFPLLKAEQNIFMAGILALLISFGLCLFFKWNRDGLAIVKKYSRLKVGISGCRYLNFIFFRIFMQCHVWRPLKS